MSERRPIRDHICVSSIDWEFLWQGHQELMARFAREGSRVLWVENTGVRTPRLADWRRLVKRAVSWGRRPSGRRAPDLRGLWVLSPIVLPFPWSPAARILNRIFFASGLPYLARKVGLQRPVVWTFLPTPLAVDTLRAFRKERSLAVYYAIADFSQLVDRPDRLPGSEAELLAEVDLVFTDGRILQERLAARHPRVVFAPFGVAEHFFAPRGPEPDDVAEIPHPRVGYVGGLHRHVDAELLRAVIAAMPETSFLFVGPVQSANLGLDRLPNAFFLGEKAHSALPGYVDAFDACLIPYRLTTYTRSVYPTKLHEYLARRKPVVSTALAEVVRAEEGRDLVAVASGTDEWVEAIRHAVRRASPRDEAARVAAAQEQHWDLLSRRMRDEIERAIAQDRAT